MGVSALSWIRNGNAFIQSEFERFSDVCLLSTVDATSCVTQLRNNSSTACQPTFHKKTERKNHHSLRPEPQMCLEDFWLVKKLFCWHHLSASATDREIFNSDVYSVLNTEFMTCENVKKAFDFITPDVDMSQYDWIPNEMTPNAAKKIPLKCELNRSILLLVDLHWPTNNVTEKRMEEVMVRKYENERKS